MANRVGQQLGNYRLMDLLGEGGFAEVYLGEHVHLGTQAAIKVLSAKLSTDEVDRFREEARMIAQLKHPHIVRILDFGVEGGVPYLVMEYAAGGTLRQRHPKGTQLTPAVILPYVQQVASALQYAHEKKLIHRDIKPENMLLGESGEVLLSDFGIAIVAQSSRYQSTQDTAGTIAYMAPEQIQGHPRPASDQYSLSIVIYEWLAGERPFTGSMSEIVAKHLGLPPPPLRDKSPSTSHALEQVVLTALEKDPQQRFITIQAFATALEEATLLDQPTQMIRPSLPSSQLPTQPASAQAPTIVVSSSRLPKRTAPVQKEDVAGPRPPGSRPSPPPQPGVSRGQMLLSFVSVAVILIVFVLGFKLFTAQPGSTATSTQTTPTATPPPSPTQNPFPWRVVDITASPINLPVGHWVKFTVTLNMPADSPRVFIGVLEGSVGIGTCEGSTCYRGCVGGGNVGNTCNLCYFESAPGTHIFSGFVEDQATKQRYDSGPDQAVTWYSDPSAPAAGKNPCL